MKTIALTDRSDIQRYLRSIRCFQNSPTLGADERELQRLIEAHTITIEPGQTDSYYGGGIPLDNWMSAIDDPERLARISEVYLDFERLRSGELILLAEVLKGAGLSPSPAAALA
jgi:hypothetical protein